MANCVGCHTGTGPGLGRGKLSMASFEKLMAGGKRGADIVPGDPDLSHLVLMIKGEETPKMPPNNGQRALADSAAEKIEAWVKAGARLDAGLSATDSLDKYAPTTADLRRDELARMKPEERDKVIEQTGRDRWKKATATVPDFTSGTHFVAFGNLPGDRTAKLLKAMEAEYALANRLLSGTKGPALDPAEKISLYIFKDQNSFVEFVRTVESQEVEPGEMARARLNVESPYLVAADPLNGGEETAQTAPKRGSRWGKKADDTLGGPERSLLGLLTEQLIAETANKTGKPPKWVALGLGAFAAHRVESGSPYYRRLQGETLEKRPDRLASQGHRSPRRERSRRDHPRRRFFNLRMDRRERPALDVEQLHPGHARRSKPDRRGDQQLSWDRPRAIPDGVGQLVHESLRTLIDHDRPDSHRPGSRREPLFRPVRPESHALTLPWSGDPRDGG